MAAVFHSLPAFFHSPWSALIAVLILGVLLISFGVLWEMIARRRNLFQKGNDKRSPRSLYRKALTRVSFIRHSEERLNKQLAILRVNYTAEDITDLRLVCVLIAAVVSVLLSNVLIFFPLLILAWQIPYSVVERRIQKRLELFETQFLNGMKEFLTEFSTLRNAQQAFINVAPKLEYPLRYEFEYIARRLNSGETPRVVLEDFAARTMNQWTALFARLLIFHFEEGANVEPQILSLMEQLSTDKILKDKNRTEVAAIRNLNLFLNALIPLVFLTNRFMNPDSAKVFTETSMGHLALFVVALLSLTSLYLGKRLTNM